MLPLHSFFVWNQMKINIRDEFKRVERKNHLCWSKQIYSFCLFMRSLKHKMRFFNNKLRNPHWRANNICSLHGKLWKDYGEEYHDTIKRNETRMRETYQISSSCALVTQILCVWFIARRERIKKNEENIRFKAAMKVYQNVKEGRMEGLRRITFYSSFIPSVETVLNTWGDSPS